MLTPFVLRCVIGVWVGASLAFATPEPAWKSDLTPISPPSHPPLSPVRLHYQASWKGWLDAGTIRLEFGNPKHVKPGFLVARFTGASTGAAATLYDYKGWYWSEIDPRLQLPRLFHTVEDVQNRRVTYQLDYSRKGVAWNRNTKDLKRGVDYDTKGVVSLFPVHDVFSAMLFVRGRKLDDGDVLALIVQPGDDPYLLNVHVQGRGYHLNRKAIRMGISMRKIHAPTLTLVPYSKLKQATLWLSDDADRIPLEIRAAVFIGDVRVTLTSQTRL